MPIFKNNFRELLNNKKVQMRLNNLTNSNDRTKFANSFQCRKLD